MNMKKIQLNSLFFRISLVWSSGATVFYSPLQRKIEFSTEELEVDFKTSGLVAMAGSLQIPRLSTATASHFLRRPEFCCLELSSES